MKFYFISFYFMLLLLLLKGTKGWDGGLDKAKRKRKTDFLFYDYAKFNDNENV